MHVLLAVIVLGGEGLGQPRLAHAGGPAEEEEGDGAIGVAEARADAADDGLDGAGLPLDAGGEGDLEREQRGGPGGGELVDGGVGPLGDAGRGHGVELVLHLHRGAGLVQQVDRFSRGKGA